VPPPQARAEKTLAFINPCAFRYQFDFWGKNRAALEAALGERAAEEAEFAEARLLLTTAIARSYIRGVALAQQLALAQEMVDAPIFSSPKSKIVRNCNSLG
jgi:Outer membrane efflux protein